MIQDLFLVSFLVTYMVASKLTKMARKLILYHPVHPCLIEGVIFNDRQ